jgi:hypothetical protein
VAMTMAVAVSPAGAQSIAVGVPPAAGEDSYHCNIDRNAQRSDSEHGRARHRLWMT